MERSRQREGTDVTTWEQNRKRINGLWPDISWTPTKRELWTERLQVLDQLFLRNALESVAIRYTRQKPAIKWVLCEYENMVQEHNEREQREQNRMRLVNELQAQREAIAEERVEMENVLRQLPPEELQRLVRAVKLELDPEKPLAQWSTFDIGITYGAHTRRA